MEEKKIGLVFFTVAAIAGNLLLAGCPTPNVPTPPAARLASVKVGR